MLLRTYYDQIHCIVMDAFLNMSPKGEKVNEEVLAKELQLPLSIVHEPLNQLSMTYILKMTREDRTAVEERAAAQAGGGIAQQTGSTVVGVTSSLLTSITAQSMASSNPQSSTRPRKPVLFWEVDYEQLVNVIKYRHEMILRRLEKRVELALACPNPKCPMYKQPVTFDDAVMNRALRRAAATNSALGTVGTAPSWGGDTTANVDKLLCEVELCSTELVEQSDEIDTLTELKKIFNEQLKPLNEQTALVERLLYERRELRNAAIAGGEMEKLQAEEEARQAALALERARAAEITEEERRQREILRREFLLQDDATAEEIQAREEQIRALRQKEEAEQAAIAAAERKKQEEEAYERELAAIHERRRRQELEQELLDQAQAQADAQALANAQAAANGVKLELDVSAITKEEWGEGWGVDVKGWGDESAATGTAANEIYVMVNGERMLLSEITQEHLDQMTDEELTEYERVSELYRGGGGHLASYFDTPAPASNMNQGSYADGSSSAQGDATFVKAELDDTSGYRGDTNYDEEYL